MAPHEPPPDDVILQFCNSGEDLIDTNYFNTDLARSGYAYLTWNAGVARLLLPESLEQHLPDMLFAYAVAITHTRQSEREVLQIQFEDGSSAPLVLTIETRMTDRALESVATPLSFIIYTQQGKIERIWQCHFRRSGCLPPLG